MASQCPQLMTNTAVYIRATNNFEVVQEESGTVIVEAIRCYSCANDFIVWHWRHFFLKRNYGITASDQNCAKSDYRPEITQLCPSTCFIMYLNGTNRHSGMVTVLGTVRGCSSQFMTNDQHSQLGLGSHSRISQIGNYLSSEFDMYDIMEHWCFCANNQCNEKVATMQTYIHNPLQIDASIFSTNTLPRMLRIEPF
ncbi:Protein F16B3.3, isoform b [Dirofilaria immitis]|nr:Protein F16B3.3, isoform b [Dirofilaria immitis]